MANLVPMVNTLEPTEERIIEFKGLDRRTVTAEGSMAEMMNLTSDNYPVLTQRKPRGEYPLPEGTTRPMQLMSRYEKIAMIVEMDNGDYKFIYDGVIYDQVVDLTVDTRMVAINTKICFFPDKTYVELTNFNNTPAVGNFGYLEEEAEFLSAEPIDIQRDYAYIDLPAESTLGYDDVVSFRDATVTYTDGGGTVHQDVPLENAFVIESVEDVIEDDQVVARRMQVAREVITGITGEDVDPETVTFRGKIERTVPDLEHVIEWNNRLWGVNSAENTIYASKLGDPKNWQYYQGTGIDSFYAQQGTDGKWTGSAQFSSHIIFFKQSSMTRIYGTSPSNYQITNTECYGVEEGSPDSVITINDTVFWKSVVGIMAYEGGTPVCISGPLNMDYAEVISGTEGQKYYASIHRKGSGYELMVYDIEKGLWHREDTTRFRSCATIDNRLYFAKYNDFELFPAEDLYPSEYLLCGGAGYEGGVGIINPLNPTEDDEELWWFAVLGPFDEYIEEMKVYSKLAIRLKANGPCKISVGIIWDDYADEFLKDLQIAKYHPVMLMEDHVVSTRGEVIPVIPVRCDKYVVYIEGKGRCEIKSLTRRVRRGSFNKIDWGAR